MGHRDLAETWHAISFVISPRSLSLQGVHLRRSASTPSKLIGQYGLKNKKEIWRVRLALAKIRSTARTLLTKDEKDATRIFEGQALMRRMIRYGILDEDKQRLDYVLSLSLENFMERRLQTLVFKRGLAKSIHHARVLIRQRHIRVGRQVVNVPSFMVRVES